LTQTPLCGTYLQPGHFSMEIPGHFSAEIYSLAPLSGGGTANFLRADGTWAAPVSGGTGTVTSVSVTTANGVSGTVATATSTPAITLVLGAITPTTIVATGAISGTNLSGTNTGDQTITLTGDITGSGAGSLAATIAAGAVSLSKMANMATGSLFYRKTALAGAPEVQTLATLKTDLGLTGTNSGDQTTVSGNAGSATVLQTSRNFSVSGGGISAAAVGFDGSAAVVLSSSVDAGHITLARMANLAANSFIGNNTGAAATPVALTGTQATSLLDNFTATLKGLTPLSGGGTANFLRADGTWAAPTGGSGTVTSVGGTGTVSGITLSGTVTTTGNLTLGGTLSLASPGTIGATTPSPGTFTTLSSTSAVYQSQQLPILVSSTATLTAAQILNLIIECSSSTAVVFTMPTGTLMDAAILSGTLAVNQSFDWTVMNTGASAGSITFGAATGMLIYAPSYITIGTSARFRTIKIAANSFKTYRLS
jgi:hypothetical protein